MKTPMSGHECYHCRQWVDAGTPYDCWTTTEGALTRDLPEDLRDAYDRLRETAESFGEQRIYASHHSIMYSRKACYFFVRPKAKVLEVCIFLGRRLDSDRVRRVTPASRTKIAHLVNVRHRDEVEAPLTDWLREAYDQSVALGERRPVKRARTNAPTSARGRKPVRRKAR